MIEREDRWDEDGGRRRELIAWRLALVERAAKIRERMRTTREGLDARVRASRPFAWVWPAREDGVQLLLVAALVSTFAVVRLFAVSRVLAGVVLLAALVAGVRSLFFVGKMQPRRAGARAPDLVAGQLLRDQKTELESIEAEIADTSRALQEEYVRSVTSDPYRGAGMSSEARLDEARFELSQLDARIRADERELSFGYRAARVAEKPGRQSAAKVRLKIFFGVLWLASPVTIAALGWMVVPIYVSFAGMAIAWASRVDRARPFDPEEFEESTVPSHLRAMRRQLDVDRSHSVVLLEEIAALERSLDANGTERAAAIEDEEAEPRGSKRDGNDQRRA